MQTVDTLAPHLYTRFLDLRSERGLRHRDAARALGVSEGEAIAAAVGRSAPLRAVRLKGPWPALFEQLPTLGRVMALTRNEAAVHEKTGSYASMSHDGPVGLALGADIDLRIFYMRWAHVFAVTEDTARGVQRSLQVYDAAGTAVHKVFLKDGADLGAWAAFTDAHADAEQAPGGRFEPVAVPAAPAADERIDVEGFRAAWLAMADTHEFFPLLRRFGVARTQALRLAPAGMAHTLPNSTVRALLQGAAAAGTSIMCFVGNPGMIQIHTGPVKKIELMGPWVNVLDPGFSLHLREDLVAQTWLVRKPTADGIVTSVELFDAQGETIAMFFGERKPGQPEIEPWRELLATLPGVAA
jgi:putative hemin transport protein